MLQLEFEFLTVGEKHFFGLQQEWVSPWHRVAITDLERTVLDMVASPRVFGTLGAGMETLEAYLGRLGLDRLVGHALRYDVGAVIKRLGWMLEALRVPASVTDPLRAYPVEPTTHWIRRVRGRNINTALACAEQPAAGGQRCRPLTR